MLKFNKGQVRKAGINMKQQNRLTISGAIHAAVPDRRLVKLSEDQTASLRRAGDIALAIIGTAGIIAIAAVAPNLLQIIPRLADDRNPRQKFSRKDKIKKIENTFYYLKRSGLVHFSPTSKELLLSLTDKGRQRFFQLELETLKISRPSHWDGRWWLVAADIPTRTHRAGADMLRKKLKRLGFYPFQRTLWLHPFDPRKEVEFLCRNYGIAEFVTLMEVSRLDKEDEGHLKAHFRKLEIF